MLSVKIQEPVDPIPEEGVRTHLCEVFKLVHAKFFQRPTIFIEDEFGEVYVLGSDL